MAYLRPFRVGFRSLVWRWEERQCGGLYARRLHAARKSSDSSVWPHPIYVSDRLQDRKSIFLAHASTLPSSSDLAFFLDHLTTLSALKRATHRMYAYRTSSPHSSLAVTGGNDGGESGSGKHLTRLLELTGCENVVVVVSRWYGGVKLGSDRWKRISEVAKEALDNGGFMNDRSSVLDDTASAKRNHRRRR